MLHLLLVLLLFLSGLGQELVLRNRHLHKVAIPVWLRRMHLHGHVILLRALRRGTSYGEAHDGRRSIANRERLRRVVRRLLSTAADRGAQVALALGAGPAYH